MNSLSKLMRLHTFLCQEKGHLNLNILFTISHTHTQDGTFSVVDFLEAFQEHEVQRVLRAYPDTITMDVHCAPVGNWVSIQDKTLARLCRVRLNPVDVLSSGSDKLNAFVDYLASMIVPTEISELLESSDVVGNIRFSHPTLYVFPGGQGDAALFGINGFNMLGKSRRFCSLDGEQ